MLPHFLASPSVSFAQTIQTIRSAFLSRRRVRKFWAVLLVMTLHCASVQPVASNPFHRGWPGGLTPFSNLALRAESSPFSLLSAAVQQGDGMPGRPPLPQREEAKAPPTRAEKEARVARIQINLADDTWIASKQRFTAGAVPLDQDGNAVHGLAAEWSTSDKQVVFVTKEGRAVAGRPGSVRLTARAGSKQESVKINVYDDGRTDRAETSGSNKKYSRQNSLVARARKISIAFAHSPMPAPPDDRLPDNETNTLYEPRNDVGKPEGRTEAAAQTAAAANSGTETPGSANFTFSVPLVGIAGRQLDATLALNYNSRV